MMVHVPHLIQTQLKLTHIPVADHVQLGVAHTHTRSPASLLAAECLDMTGGRRTANKGVCWVGGVTPPNISGCVLTSGLLRALEMALASWSITDTRTRSEPRNRLVSPPTTPFTSRLSADDTLSSRKFCTQRKRR